MSQSGEEMSQGGRSAYKLNQTNDLKTVHSKMNPVTVNFEKLNSIVAKLNTVLFKETKIEVVMSMLNEVSRLYGCKKASFFACSTVL
jgi:hypothetical protein